MNRLISAVLLTSLSPLLFSQQAIANRPAAEDEPKENSDINAERQPEAQQQAPSSVELMMQQETQQSGDVIMLPPKEMQAGETVRIKLLDFPRRGMSMDKVKNEYGQPSVISDSIGKPPITRWTYSDRIVYFEHSTVIHVVAR